MKRVAKMMKMQMQKESEMRVKERHVLRECAQHDLHDGKQHVNGGA